MRNHKLIAATAALLAASAIPAAAGGGFCPVAPDASWKAVHQSTTLELQAAFDVDKNLILNQFTLAYQRIMSAVKVDTSQENIDGQKVSQAIKKSDEALADVMTQTDVNNEISKAHADFGPDGQSVDACGSSAMIDDVSTALSVYKTSAREYATPDRVYAAAGSTITPTQAIADSLKKHRDKYCSASEAQAGLCDGAGGEAGADVDILTLFTGRSDEAKDALVNNLVGLPLPKPTAQEAATPRGSLMMVDAMRAEAVRSPALVSLAVVRAMGNRGGGSILGGDTETSFNGALDKIMDLYGGGSGYAAWHTELATKNERGLLQELNKLRALSIKMRTYRSESNTRIAAVMAAVLAAEADGK